MNFARAERRRQERIKAKVKAPLPSYINLIEYVKLRTRCSTGMAEKVLLLGALKVNTNTVGFKFDKAGRKHLDPMLDAKHRDDIVIAPVKAPG